MKCIRRVLGLLAMVAALCAGTATAEPPERLYVFGDSLSDTGNLVGATGSPFPPPFFQGSRVSNGPVAAELLAEQLGLPLNPARFLELVPEQGTNYAVAGARAGRNEPGDLRSQVGAFLVNNAGAVPDDSLVVMFIGGNDLFDARDETNFFKSLQIIDRAVNTIEEQLAALLAAGADSIMVLNAPDVGFTPSTSLVAEAIGVPYLGKITAVQATEFSRKLHRAVRRLERASGVDIIEVDVNTLFSSVLRNGRGLGYINTQDACFETRNLAFNPECENGVLFDGFFFFDEVHPTAVTHQRLFRALYAVTPM